MKISESWLREWVDPALAVTELAEQITMAGLEVDAIEPVATSFGGVVVAEIVAVTPHPNADKLRVCQVNAGGDHPVQVVCGAPNARPGIRVPFATLGAVLADDFKIKKATLRGVESFGMLCAQAELQLGDGAEGLWELAAEAPIGQCLREYLQLDDVCIEVDLTPNRSDCLSIKGIAREVGALNRLVVQVPDMRPVSATMDETLPVALACPDACPHYVGRIIRHVDLSQPTPLWMKERLRRSGIGAKDIVVDVTNYVLLELGQPMHAFDLDKLEGEIVVRQAEVGERLSLLNGQSVDVLAGTLVIADQQGPVALAGIMGGSRSAVSAATQHVFLESAFFAPAAIAGRARQYGLHTDSSHRFERGVDYQLQVDAIERATALITTLAGGEVGPVLVAAKPHALCDEKVVCLRRKRILQHLGFNMPDDDVLDILTRLGLTLKDSDAEGWHFSVPSYRFDISIEADLLEELARIYGYNRLPNTTLSMALNLSPRPEGRLSLAEVRSCLVARDYQEAISYSFVDAELQRQLDPKQAPLALLNPISADMSVMRTSLWQGLLKALLHNVHRQQSRVRLFETGLRFIPDVTSAVIDQGPMIAGLIYGHRYAESWTEKPSMVDFYDLKGDVASLLALTGRPEAFSFQVAEHPALHPGQAAAVHYCDGVAGYMGALHPQLQQAFGLPHSVYMFELSQSSLLAAAVPVFSPLSKFPEVRRDLAVIVDQSVMVATLEEAVKSVAGPLLTKLKVFDVYVGKGIDSHRKSIALGLTFQHLSRTLTDEEIHRAIESVVNHLKVVFDADLR